MVGRQRGLEHLTDHDGAPTNNGRGSDLTDGEDRDLRRHHDRRELGDVEHAQIAEGERRFGPLRGLDLSSFGPSYEVTQAGGDRHEIAPLAADEGRREQSVGNLDRNTDVDGGPADQLLAVPYRIERRVLDQRLR